MRFSDVLTQEQFDRAKRRLELDLGRERLWKRTKKMNLTRTFPDGRTAIVFPAGNRFTFAITSNSENTFSNQRFGTQHLAMRAALTFVLEKP